MSEHRNEKVIVSRNPWIDASGADAEALEKTVAGCPSGALTFERLR